jgi:hypothetical protein
MESLFGNPPMVLFLIGFGLIIVGFIGRIETKRMNVLLLKYQRILCVAVGLLLAFPSLILLFRMPTRPTPSVIVTATSVPGAVSTTASPLPSATPAPPMPTTVASQRFATLDVIRLFLEAVGLLTVVVVVAGGLVRLYFVAIRLLRSLARRSRRFRLQRTLEKALQSYDRKKVHGVHVQNALWKLTSPSESECRIGVQELAALGASTSLTRGFDALADELASRRETWSLRFEILKALDDIAGPIREAKIDQEI